MLAGLGALAAVSLALSACSTSTSASSSPSARASASPSVAPAAALTNAITALKGKGFDAKIAQGGLSGGGSIDPSNDAGTIEAKGTQAGVTLDISFTQIGDDMWAKIDLGPLSGQLGIDPTKWMKLDPTKLTSENAKPFDTSTDDSLELGKLFASVKDAKRTDATHLTGTVDLTKATGSWAPRFRCCEEGWGGG